MLVHIAENTSCLENRSISVVATSKFFYLQDLSKRSSGSDLSPEDKQYFMHNFKAKCSTDTEHMLKKAQSSINLAKGPESYKALTSEVLSSGLRTYCSFTSLSKLSIALFSDVSDYSLNEFSAGTATNEYPVKFYLKVSRLSILFELNHSFSLFLQILLSISEYVDNRTHTPFKISAISALKKITNHNYHHQAYKRYRAQATEYLQ